MDHLAILLCMTGVLLWGTSTGSGGAVLTTLAVFSGTNGARPSSGLLLARDGNFYGTTAEGGANDLGTIFRMTPDGGLTTVASFNGRNGKIPCGGLVQGEDGALYGAAAQGGRKSGDGVVFKLTSEGNLTALFSFSDYDDNGGESPDGFSPRQLFDGNDGWFYGRTARHHFGGGAGTAFRINPRGSLETLATFESQAEPAWLVRAFNGHYSFTKASLGFRLAPLSTMQIVKKLGSLGTLAAGEDGKFYGTTTDGGPGGGGTVFRVSSTGAVTNLVSFDSNNSVNGRSPCSELTVGRDGNLYGTTFAGDTNGPPPDLTKYATRNANGAWVLMDTNRPFPGLKPDLGTVFKMVPSGKITTLAVFYRTNGCYPTRGLAEGKDGTFYGTTTEGGIGPSPKGTLFRLRVTP